MLITGKDAIADKVGYLSLRMGCMSAIDNQIGKEILSDSFWEAYNLEPIHTVSELCYAEIQRGN
jgi:hypothetical protein